jgi:hypothetical protein
MNIGKPFFVAYSLKSTKEHENPKLSQGFMNVRLETISGLKRKGYPGTLSSLLRPESLV